MLEQPSWSLEPTGNKFTSRSSGVELFISSGDKISPEFQNIPAQILSRFESISSYGMQLPESKRYQYAADLQGLMSATMMETSKAVKNKVVTKRNELLRENFSYELAQLTAESKITGEIISEMAMIFVNIENNHAAISVLDERSLKAKNTGHFIPTPENFRTTVVMPLSHIQLTAEQAAQVISENNDSSYSYLHIISAAKLACALDLSLKQVYKQKRAKPDTYVPKLESINNVLEKIEIILRENY